MTITEEYLSRSRLFRRLRSGPHGHLVELYAARLVEVGLARPGTWRSLNVVDKAGYPSSIQNLLELSGYPLQNNSYSGSASPIQTGAAPCKARPTDHRSIYTSARVGTSMPRLPNPQKPTTPATPSAPCCTARFRALRDLAKAGKRRTV